jgi:hypothetical protein
LIDLYEVAAVETRRGEPRAIPGYLTRTARTCTVPLTMRSGVQITLDGRGTYVFQEWFLVHVADDVTDWSEIEPALTREWMARSSAERSRPRSSGLPVYDAIDPSPQRAG